MSAFEEIGNSIDDGDIGYVGEYHASFVRGRLPVIGERATESGTHAAQTLIAYVRKRFPATVDTVRGQLGVTKDQYQAARRRILGGSA